MFSLVITIISVALVAALALATLYYGGSSFNQSSSKANAARLINQGQQLLGAADLFKAENGRWPASMSELVDAKFLKSIPFAQEAMRQALAAPTPWVMAMPSVPVFTVPTEQTEACRSVNEKGYGQLGIRNQLTSGALYQCYDSTAQGLLTVVSRSPQSLESVTSPSALASSMGSELVSSLPAPGNNNDASWALSPAAPAGTLIADGAPSATLVVASCKAHRNAGKTLSGVYRIDVDGSGALAPVDVFCDMTTDGGGWTVFQKRTNGALSFYRGYAAYANGFGSAASEYWLGNEYISALTSVPSALRVEASTANGQTGFASYSAMRVGSAATGYQLSVSGFTGGSMGDALSYHNGSRFSTFDKDQDGGGSRSCAELYKGAWWYQDCYHSNLNGLYNAVVPNEGMRWAFWSGVTVSSTTVMMVRAVN